MHMHQLCRTRKLSKEVQIFLEFLYDVVDFSILQLLLDKIEVKQLNALRTV